MAHPTPNDQQNQISWLSYDDVAQILGVSRARVKRLVEESTLGSRLVDGQRRIPDAFLVEGQPLPHLRGTLISLADAGYSQDEACDWMLAPNDAIGGDSPAHALRQSRKTAVRQAIQFLAF